MNAENSETPNLQDGLQRIKGLNFLTTASPSIQVDDTMLHIFPRLSQGTESEFDTDGTFRFISERTGTQLLDVVLNAREGNGTVNQLQETIDHALTVFEVVGIE